MLSLQFNYTEQEFIDYQLYIASKSPSQQKRMRRNRWLVALIYLGIAGIGFLNKNNTQIYIFAALAIVWYIAYPLWSKKFHKKHFMQFILQQNKARIGNKVQLDFTDNIITIQEDEQHIEIPIQDVVEIAELKQLILLRLNSEQVIIVHKVANVAAEQIISFMKSLALKRAIRYVDDTKWVW